MSYQLIYTSAPHLLDPSLSGYGVVARSEKLPRALEKKLLKISGVKEENKLISGPQLSYHILDCAGATFHVLSCIQSAGADYSGRECHIAHHLALTQDEVRLLRSNQARPTPASVILGLYRDQFWKAEWKEKPHYITDEPSLSTDLLPEIDQQSTWKELTGHKYNAKALITPPYEHDCLIVVKSGTRSLDILHLLAESDWLSHLRGWGITFTTTGVASDTFAQTQRIAVLEESAMEGKARRSGRPTLHLEHKLLITREQELNARMAESQRLPAPMSSKSSILTHNERNILETHSANKKPQTSRPSLSTAPAPPLAMSPSNELSKKEQKPAAQDTSLFDQHQLTQVPYKYKESPDSQNYQPAKPLVTRRNVLSTLFLVLGFVILAVSTYISNSNKQDSTAGHDEAHSHSDTEISEPLPPLYASPEAQTQLDIQAINEQLSILASLDYDAKQTASVLSELSALTLMALKQGAPDLQDKLQNLYDIIQQLRKCKEVRCDHQQNIAKLIRYSLDVGIPVEPLVRLYLRHATHNMPPRRWASELSEKQRHELITELKKNKLSHLFDDPQFFSYLHALDRHDPVNRHYESTGQQLNDILTTYNHLNSGSLVIINEGDTLPLILQNLFQRNSFLLDQGKIGIYPISDLPFIHRLLRSKYTVKFKRSDEPNVKSFQLYDKGKAVPSIQMELTANTKFYNFQLRQQPAVLTLKLSSSPATDRYIFLPHISIQLKPKKNYHPIPQITREDILIRELDLECLPPDSWQPHPQLQLSDNLSLRHPWKVIHQPIELVNTPHLNIPRIIGFRNIVRVDETDPRGAALTYSAHINRLPHSLFPIMGHPVHYLRHLNFNSLLQKEFYILANSCATQQESLGMGFYSIANIYYILLALDDVDSISEVEKLMMDYLKCYTNSSFALLMNRILSDIPALQLSPDEARGENSMNKIKRAQYAELLSDAGTRIAIRKHIRAYLSAKLMERYETAKRELEQQQLTTPSHQLELYKLEKKDNSLIWHFRLNNSSPAS